MPQQKKHARPVNQADKRYIPIAYETIDRIVNRNNQLYHKGKIQTPLDITTHYRRFMLRNIDKIDLVKQSIMIDCLATAQAVSKHLTPAKLDASSAAQLSLIRRESIYSAQMIKDGQISTGNGQTINVMQIILDRVINPESPLQNNNQMAIDKALVIPAETVAKDCQNDDK
jgi:hypothetical protein